MQAHRLPLVFDPNPAWRETFTRSLIGAGEHGRRNLKAERLLIVYCVQVEILEP
jgi:hypothetical protein